MNLQKELGLRDEQLDRAHRMVEGITAASDAKVAGLEQRVAVLEGQQQDSEIQLGFMQAALEDEAAAAVSPLLCWECALSCCLAGELRYFASGGTCCIEHADRAAHGRGALCACRVA